MNIEYRVRPVTRYIVTRYHQDNFVNDNADGSVTITCGVAGCESCGEFDRQDAAEKVAKALADAEPEGDVSFNGYPIERCLSALPPTSNQD